MIVVEVDRLAWLCPSHNFLELAVWSWMWKLDGTWSWNWKLWNGTVELLVLAPGCCILIRVVRGRLWKSRDSLSLACGGCRVVVRTNRLTRVTRWLPEVR